MIMDIQVVIIKKLNDGQERFFVAAYDCEHVEAKQLRLYNPETKLFNLEVVLSLTTKSGQQVKRYLLRNEVATVYIDFSDEDNTSQKATLANRYGLTKKEIYT